MIGQAERLYELSNLIKDKTGDNSECKLISFTSGKGGTGKSFLSGNIAFQLSELGSRVLLIDMDINLSNLSTLFNVNSKKSIYHYLTYNQNLEDITYSYSENLDIILGESGKIDHPQLTEERVNRLIFDLEKLRSIYDFILVDNSSGINNGQIQILLKSNEVILVTTPEPTSVMDAYVIFKMLKNYGANNNQSVLVNKIFEPNEGLNTFQNLEMATKHFLKSSIKYLGEIPFSRDIIKSVQDQSLFSEYNKNTKITHQINKICEKFKIPAIG